MTALIDVEYVTDWLPGTQDGEDETVLEQLIEAESQAITLRTGRKFVKDADESVRIFDVPVTNTLGLYEPEIPGGVRDNPVEVLIDDLSAAPTLVELRDQNGVLVKTLVVNTDYVLLPRNRETWQPITAMRFRNTVSVYAGYELHVTGTWGFPSVPEDIKQACRARVAAKFLPSIARVATAFAGEMDQGFDLSRALAASFQAVDSYRYVRVG